MPDLKAVEDTKDDLPDSLKSQLSKGYLEGTGGNLAKWLEKLALIMDGAMNIDEILVGWYRKHGDVLKRASTQSKLMRLVTADDIHQPRKGHYTMGPAPKKEDV